MQDTNLSKAELLLVVGAVRVQKWTNRANGDKSTKFGTEVDFWVSFNKMTGAKLAAPPGGRHLGFQNGRPSRRFFVYNLSSVADTNVIPMAIPMFSGMPNPMKASDMTSHGRHIGFQDGRHENCPYSTG